MEKRDFHVQRTNTNKAQIEAQIVSFSAVQISAFILYALNNYTLSNIGDSACFNGRSKKYLTRNLKKTIAPHEFMVFKKAQIWAFHIKQRLHEYDGLRTIPLTVLKSSSKLGRSPKNRFC